MSFFVPVVCRVNQESSLPLIFFGFGPRGLQPIRVWSLDQTSVSLTVMLKGIFVIWSTYMYSLYTLFFIFFFLSHPHSHPLPFPFLSYQIWHHCQLSPSAAPTTTIASLLLTLSRRNLAINNHQTVTTTHHCHHCHKPPLHQR